MKMREQRLMGLVMVILSGWLLAWAFAGQTPEERDVTAVLLTLPLGLYMVYTEGGNRGDHRIILSSGSSPGGPVYL